jgi:hypothetical protein
MRLATQKCMSILQNSRKTINLRPIRAQIERAMREADRDRARAYAAAAKREQAQTKSQRKMRQFRESLPKPKPHPLPRVPAEWEDTAKRFEGIGGQLKAQLELRNIRLATSGYQVVIRRRRQSVSKCFAGFGQRSLEAAKRWRDAELKRVPSLRKNEIPVQVLEKLGLSQPLIGITRMPSRSVYRIQFRTGDGKVHLKSFYFRHVPEEDAYASAINFLRDLRAGKQ